jgi:hypothetical protein
VFLVAAHTTGGRSFDRSAFERASGNAPPPYRVAGQHSLRTIDAATVALALVGLAALAIVRRRVARAVAGAFVVLVSVGSAELLKRLLPFPPGRPPTLPSGHTAVAVSLGIALVLAVPPVLRPTAAVAGAAYGAAIGFSVVVIGWHLPSDAIASFFLCGFWASLAGLALPGTPRRPTVSVRGLGVAVVAVGAALVVAGLIASRHPGALHAVRSRPALLAAAGAYGVLSLALFTVVTPLLGERA